MGLWMWGGQAQELTHWLLTCLLRSRVQGWRECNFMSADSNWLSQGSGHGWGGTQDEQRSVSVYMEQSPLHFFFSCRKLLYLAPLFSIMSNTLLCLIPISVIWRWGRIQSSGAWKMWPVTSQQRGSRSRRQRSGRRLANASFGLPHGGNTFTLSAGILLQRSALVCSLLSLWN